MNFITENLKSISEEMNSNYSDVLLHTLVRWPSRRKALERFFTLQFQITAFLQQNA